MVNVYFLNKTQNFGFGSVNKRVAKKLPSRVVNVRCHSQSKLKYEKYDKYETFVNHGK